MVLVLSIDPILRVGIGIGIDSIPRLRSSIEFLEACLSRLKTNFIAWNLNLTIDNEHKYNWSLTETYIMYHKCRLSKETFIFIYEDISAVVFSSKTTL